MRFIPNMISLSKSSEDFYTFCKGKTTTVLPGYLSDSIQYDSYLEIAVRQWPDWAMGIDGGTERERRIDSKGVTDGYRLL